LTKARYNRYTDEEMSQFKYGKNPRGFFTLSELATALSPSDDRRLLRNKISDPRVKLAFTRDNLNALEALLESSKNFASRETAYALTLIDNLRPDFDQFLKSSIVGRYAHVLFEDFVERYFKSISNDFIVKSEEYINKPFSNHRIDTSIIRNTQFDNIISKQNLLQFSDKISKILIDYTMLTNDYLFDKLFKHYQQEDQFLILVVYNADQRNLLRQKLKLPQYRALAPYIDNVAILDIGEFGTFLGLSGASLTEFIQINQIIQNSMISDSVLLQLEQRVNQILGLHQTSLLDFNN